MNKSSFILFVVGARPNFVKLAPICHELSQRRTLNFKIVHTGQHYEKSMSDVFFSELDIPAPDFHLHAGSGTHARQSASIMIGLEEICLKNSILAMVVIGDVNSTLAGALVAAKLHIPIVHVEAGLRSFNRKMPEEINRIVTDHISDILFAPSEIAMSNLRTEGLLDRSYFSGDVMYDMIIRGIELAKNSSNVLELMQLQSRGYYLATLHRPYNVDSEKQLREIVMGLMDLDEKVILAAHPRLHKNLASFGIDMESNIVKIEPMGYLDFIYLQANAKKIITDSGGIQKEAFFLKTPCVTLRPETEWIETLQTGANILIKNRTRKEIIDAVLEKSEGQYDTFPYGDGNASKIIVDRIERKVGDEAGTEID